MKEKEKNNISKIGKMILDFNRTLLTQYELLAELEINGKADTEAYEKTIEYIKMIHEITYKKMSEITSSPREIIDYYNTFTYLNYLTDEEYIDDLIENFNKHIARRWSIQLYQFVTTNHIHIINHVDDPGVITPSDYEDFYDDYNEEERQAIMADNALYIRERNSIENDIEESVRHTENLDWSRGLLINNVFMDNILEEINNQTDPYIKEQLIRFKYMFIYSFSSFDNHFTYNPKSFTKTRLYTDLVNCLIELSDADIEDLIIEPDFRMFEKELEYLSELDEEYYKDKDNKVKTILRSNYLKTYVSINISDKSIQKMKDKLTELKCKSDSSKEIINKAYTLSRRPSGLKKVDL